MRGCTQGSHVSGSRDLQRRERAPQAGVQGDYDSVLLKTVPQAQKQIQKYSEELDRPHNASIENTDSRAFPRLVDNTKCTDPVAARLPTRETTKFPELP